MVRIFRSALHTGFGCLLVAMALGQPCAGAAQGIEPQPTDSTASAQTVSSSTLADRMRNRAENSVQAAVRRIDAFFVDEELSTFEEQATRVRLRLDTDYLQHEGWDVSPRVKLHLMLPALSQRLRLIVNDDDPDNADSAAPDAGDNSAAVRWIGKQTVRMSYSFDLGLSSRGPGVDPFIRFNAGIEYPVSENWVGQTTNRLYRYADSGFRNDFRQYFNRDLGEHLLFRSRTRLQYFEDRDYNPFFEQKLTLFHSLGDTRKLAYELLYRREDAEDSPFSESSVIGALDERYEKYVLQLRYRQQFWRPWLYIEFWPILSWPEERDYEATPAARLRVEINLGGVGDERLDE